MCVYVCMYVCVCIYVCMYVHMCVYVCICMYVCMYVCVYVSVYVFMYICIYVCVYVCIYMCICMCECMCVCMYVYKWSDNKVRELIAVKVLHTSLLNTTMVAFIVLRLGSYAPMTAHSPPFKAILELVLWNGLQSCPCITPDVINVIKMPSFNISLIFGNRKKAFNSSLISFPLFPSLTRNSMFVRCSNSSSDILAAAHQNTRRK